MASQLMVSMDSEFGAMIKAGLEEERVIVRTGTAISEIGPKSVCLDDGSSVDANVVLLSVGARASVGLAHATGLHVGPGGGLVVDEMLRTSDPDIFAAGDMVEIVHKIHGKRMRMPLAGPANRQGRIAATNALGGTMIYRGSLGTSVVKLFTRTAASTGLTERAARQAGFNTGVAYVFKGHHVAYYPGSKTLALKIVYDKDTTRLLGAQAYGESGVEKRIDVLATALQGRMTLEDLSELDLAYAPPYNSANDPVNVAAFIGLNQVSGYSPQKTPAEVIAESDAKSGILLDVRTVGEQARAPLSGVIHIPADEIRDRLQEIPHSGRIYILSKDGFLGHTTLQILKAAGHTDVFNIAGGQLAAKWSAGWNFNTRTTQSGDA